MATFTSGFVWKAMAVGSRSQILVFSTLGCLARQSLVRKPVDGVAVDGLVCVAECENEERVILPAASVVGNKIDINHTHPILCHVKEI